MSRKKIDSNTITSTPPEMNKDLMEENQIPEKHVEKMVSRFELSGDVDGATSLATNLHSIIDPESSDDEVEVNLADTFMSKLDSESKSHSFLSFLPSASVFLSMSVEILKVIAISIVAMAAGVSAVTLSGGNVAVGVGVGVAAAVLGAACTYFSDSVYSFFGSNKPEKAEECEEVSSNIQPAY